MWTEIFYYLVLLETVRHILLTFHFCCSVKVIFTYFILKTYRSVKIYNITTPANQAEVKSLQFDIFSSAINIKAVKNIRQ